MAYTKNPTWVDGEGFTLMTAAALNHMEDGIAAAASGGGVYMGPPASGIWYGNAVPSGSALQVNPPGIYFTPILLPYAITVSGIAFPTYQGAGITGSVAVYSFDGTTMTRVTSIAATPMGGSGWQTQAVTVTASTAAAGTLWIALQTGGAYPLFAQAPAAAAAPNAIPLGATPAFRGHPGMYAAGSSLLDLHTPTGFGTSLLAAAVRAA